MAGQVWAATRFGLPAVPLLIDAYFSFPFAAFLFLSPCGFQTRGSDTYSCKCFLLLFSLPRMEFLFVCLFVPLLVCLFVFHSFVDFEQHVFYKTSFVGFGCFVFTHVTVQSH